MEELNKRGEERGEGRNVLKSKRAEWSEGKESKESNKDRSREGIAPACQVTGID